MWNKIPQFKKNGFTPTPDGAHSKIRSPKATSAPLVWGFTILEVIIAILVVTIGVLSVYTAIQQIVSYTHHSASRLTAVHLGEEGIEIVRNIRDTNWLKGIAWNNGLGSGAWEADYNTIQQLSDTYDDDFLNLEAASGFYGYGPGSRTNFKRKITITPVGDTLEISVEVRWEYKGNTYGPITVQEILYNWYPE